MSKPNKSYGEDRTKPIKSITLDSFSVLSYRVMGKFSKECPDYGEYLAVLDIAMDLFREMPKEVLEQLVKSDFLKTKVSK